MGLPSAIDRRSASRMHPAGPHSPFACSRWTLRHRGLPFPGSPRSRCGQFDPPATRRLRAFRRWGCCA